MHAIGFHRRLHSRAGAHPVRGKVLLHPETHLHDLTTFVAPEEADAGSQRRIVVDLNVYRRDAKALVRAFRAGDPAAVSRAESALGSRSRRRFVLADAQHVVALESGFGTWRELRNQVLPRLDVDDVAAATTGKRFPVRARLRGVIVHLDDEGAAVAAAGKPPGWLELAREVVEAHDLNVNRAGVVFVGARYDRDDLVELALRVSDTAAHVHEALLELRDS